MLGAMRRLQIKNASSELEDVRYHLSECRHAIDELWQRQQVSVQRVCAACQAHCVEHVSMQGACRWQCAALLLHPR